MKLDIAVIADLCVDVLVQSQAVPQYGQIEQLAQDYHLELGGSAAIFAAQFARLGGRVGMYARVGNDVFGRFLRERVAALGIPTHYLASSQHSKTPLGLGLIRDEDRAMLWCPGCLHEIDIESVSRSGLFASTGHVHIASYFLLENMQAHWPAVLAEVKAAGVTVSLDTNWAPRGNWSAVHDILHYVDLFLPNEAEALNISGKSRLHDAVDWLKRRPGLTVIKRGASGVMAIERAAILNFAVPHAITENLRIADTTGAGDNFDAGFLFAWLQRAPLDKCVELGMTCAASSLARIGGIEGQLARDAAASILAMSPAID